jgi:hypothetical protein
LLRLIEQLLKLLTVAPRSFGTGDGGAGSEQCAALIAPYGLLAKEVNLSSHSKNPGDTHTRVLGMHPRAKVPKAWEMLANASFFLRDARALGQIGSAGQFFLYTHAIELSLKSFLHLHGEALKDLRTRFSHSLFKAAEAGRSRGLVLAREPTDQVLKHLDRSLKGAALRYDFDFELPSLQLVDGTADRTVKAAAKGQKEEIDPT